MTQDGADTYPGLPTAGSMSSQLTAMTAVITVCPMFSWASRDSYSHAQHDNNASVPIHTDRPYHGPLVWPLPVSRLQVLTTILIKSSGSLCFFLATTCELGVLPHLPTPPNTRPCPKDALLTLTHISPSFLVGQAAGWHSAACPPRRCCSAPLIFPCAHLICLSSLC